MLIIISPAKTLNFEKQNLTQVYSHPKFISQSKILIKELRKLKPDDIAKLMKISPKLAYLNFERFQQWEASSTIDTAKQALLSFKGEVFNGIKVESYTKEDLDFSQSHLRILSGLYGILKPLDLISPYRLEMGTKISVSGKNNLYEFWDDKITSSLNKSINEQGDNILINLASNEYFKSVKVNKLKANVISPVFKDFKNGQYKIISIYAKKARGLMTSFILKNRLSKLDELKLFDAEGYYYNDKLSKPEQPVFTRG